MKLYKTLFLIFFSFNYLVAQIDTTNWYPLNIGNKWQFSYYESVFESSLITIEVIGDTIINQNKYFVLKSWNGLYYQRAINNKYVYEYNPYSNQEYIRYDFISPDKSIWNLDSLNGQFGIYSTEDYYVPIYEDTLKSKIYNSAYVDTNSSPPDTSWGPMVDGTAIYISKGVGITVYEQGISYGTLQGSIIDGKTYGTIVSIDNNKLIVSKYMLNQNYPNPFNPSTRINYQIARSGLVNLIIYNTLGQIVTKLVSEYQTSGQHSVYFNANNLSSGVYFYKLESGNFRKVNKMILLR